MNSEAISYDVKGLHLQLSITTDRDSSQKLIYLVFIMIRTFAYFMLQRLRGTVYTPCELSTNLC